MKKQYLTKLALCALSAGTFLALPQAAHAQTSRIYFAGYLGLSNPTDMDFDDSGTSGDLKFDNGHAFSGALGIRLNRQFRLEAEYTYNKNDLSDISVSGIGTADAGGEFKSNIVFANLYYDLDVPWKVQPFLGAGLGYGWHSAEISSVSGLVTNLSSEDSNFMWNVSGGLRYRPRDDLAFSAGYRYIDSLDLDFGGTEVDYGAHEIRIGLEWDLPVSAY